MSTTQRQALMILGSLPGIGPVRIGRLIDAFGGAPAALEASTAELLQVRDIGRECAAAIAGWRTRFDLDAQEERLARLGVNFVVRGDPGYPAKLAGLPGAPWGLYVKGCIPECPCVAIVGTRRPTLYGRREAKRFAAELARAGVCVVSGLARGIDAEAHEGALESGRTVAVLGCGLDVVYPPEHEALYGRIAAQGALVSEFALGHQPDAQSFPQRNRLISGISEAVLVVESDLRGGSMITARFATEQGRGVFAIPGRLDQPSSHGCHALIREGATLATCARDIIDEIRFQPLALQPARRGAPAPAGLAALSDDERRALGALADGAVLHPEAIARVCVMSQQAVMAALMLLELRHLAARRPDGSYEMVSGAADRC
jgi:DNA processing protein